MLLLTHLDPRHDWVRRDAAGIYSEAMEVGIKNV